MSKSALRSLLLNGALLISLPGFAQDGTSQKSPQYLETRWAEINYQLPVSQQEPAFARLANEAKAALQAKPRSAELLTWRGIILSTWAGVKGGPAALDLVKQARDVLEQTISIDPKVLDGLAQANLGCLYYQVPGRPIGFGDKEKAEQLLKQALALNPNGIDQNFFYGDYLFRRGRYTESVEALEKVLAAPPRPGHEAADNGRHKEAKELLAVVNAEYAELKTQ